MIIETPLAVKAARALSLTDGHDALEHRTFGSTSGYRLVC